MGVNRGTRVGQPPWVGFGVESASLGIGVPLDPQGASRQAEALTSRGAFLQMEVTRRKILVRWRSWFSR